METPRHIATFHPHEIRIPVAAPFVTYMGGNAMLKDDNARRHRARMVKDFMVQQQIQTMEWPACSPDLNPIEPPWD